MGLISKVKKLVSKGLMEQSLISMLNFMIIIVLSNFLPASQFAKFIIIFSSISLVYLIGTGIWATPALVFLPTIFSKSYKAYMSFLTVLNTVTSTILGYLCLTFIDLFVRDLSLSEIWFAILLVILWNQYELIRKMYYGMNQITPIFWGSILLTGSFIGFILLQHQSLTVDKALTSLCLSYLTGIVTFLIVSSKGKNKDRIREPITLKFVKKVMGEHWGYSKWTMLGLISYWLGSQGLFIIISTMITDLELSGLRITMNILGLISIFLVYFENKCTPSASKMYFEHGAEKLSDFIAQLGSKWYKAITAIVFLTAIGAYLFYDIIFGEQYVHFKYMIIYFSFYQLFLGWARPSMVGLRVLNRTKYLFYGNTLMTTFTLTVGLVLVMKLDAVGASLSLVIASLIMTLFLDFSYKKEIKRSLVASVQLGA